MNIRDAFIRLSIIIDSLKQNKSKQFVKIYREIIDYLKSKLGDLKFESLDEMPTAEFAVLLVQINIALRSIFSKYKSDSIEWIKRFTGKTREMVLNITFYEKYGRKAENLKQLNDDIEAAFDTAKNSPIVDKKTTISNSRTWDNVRHDKIETAGKRSISQMFNNFVNSSIGRVLNTTKKSRIESKSIDETLVEYEKAFNAIKSQDVANSSTAIQYAYAKTKSIVLSAYYQSYMWVSILDTRTSDICRSRNGKVYRFGSGVLPPAHYRCRSHIEPYNNQSPDDRSFRDWYNQQPDNIKNDVDNNSLTLESYSGRLDNILQ